MRPLWGVCKNLWAPLPPQPGHSSLLPQAAALTGRGPAAGPRWALGHQSALPPPHPHCPFWNLSWQAGAGPQPRSSRQALLSSPPLWPLLGPGQPPERKQKPRLRRGGQTWTRAHSGLHPTRGHYSPCIQDHLCLSDTQLYKHAPNKFLLPHFHLQWSPSSLSHPFQASRGSQGNFL